MPRGVTSKTEDRSASSVEATVSATRSITASRSCSSSAKRPSSATAACWRAWRVTACCGGALAGDVLHVRVEPAVAAPRRHVDRVDGRPHDLAVRADVALDELLVPGPAERAVDDRAAARDVVRVRGLGRRAADQLLAAAAEHPAERVVDLQPAPVGADDRHADRRVGEAAPEAVLAHPAQRAEMAREQTERDAARDDDEPAAGERVGDCTTSGSSRGELDQHAAVEDGHDRDEQPRVALRAGREGVRREAHVEQREPAGGVADREQRRR